MTSVNCTMTGHKIDVTNDETGVHIIQRNYY